MVIIEGLPKDVVIQGNGFIIHRGIKIPVKKITDFNILFENNPLQDDFDKITETAAKKFNGQMFDAVWAYPFNYKSDDVYIETVNQKEIKIVVENCWASSPNTLTFENMFYYQ